MARVRIKVIAVAVLVSLQILFLSKFHRSHEKVTKDGRSEKKLHLLIISTWRSGSSFLGQLFSQHPDVFYLMEPAWHVWRSMFRNNARVLQMAVRDLVHSVFHCDMSVFDAYMESERNVSDLFMWFSSRALCSPPVCPSLAHGDITNVTACRNHCGRGPLGQAERACHGYSHIVVKEVRIFHLNVLYPLLKDPSLNLKVLHLVRDPRAVAKSREKVFRGLAMDNGVVLNTNGTKVNDTKYEVLRRSCQSQVDMYNAATRDPPPFLRGRYKVVRYEDLVRHPLRVTRDMYTFANLDMTGPLREWIYNMTHGPGSGAQKRNFETGERDAIGVSQSWRRELEFQKVREVQEVCKEAMDTFGYRVMESETQQLDMSVDFILPKD